MELAFLKDVEEASEIGSNDEERIVLLNKKYGTDYLSGTFQSLKRKSGFVESLKISKKYKAICDSWKIPDKEEEALNYADKLALLCEGKITAEEFEK